MINDVDTVLTTTRSVRLRLDLQRPVPDEVILECIDLAEQAPSGGNQSSRRWIVLRDPAQKAAMAEIYWSNVGEFMVKGRERTAGTGHPNERVMRSAAHLAEHLAEVPAIVIPTIWGIHDNSGKPGLFDSVVQAGWSFMLALRSRGLGTAWTSAHLNSGNETAKLLGIPEGVTQIAMFPVAWTVGTDFKRAPRRPAHEVTYFDRWGEVWEHRADTLTLADGPGVVAEIDIDAPRDKVWSLVTDVGLPAEFSSELHHASWAEGSDGPVLGAQIVGTNRHDAIGEWQTTSHVVACDEPTAFAWNVGDPDDPGARWRFDLEPLHGRRTRLRMSVTLGPGPSGLSPAIEARPDKETAILTRRQGEHRANMHATVAGIKARAEEG